jgi:hypothetical protein
VAAKAACGMRHESSKKVNAEILPQSIALVSRVCYFEYQKMKG